MTTGNRTPLPLLSSCCCCASAGKPPVPPAAVAPSPGARPLVVPLQPMRAQVRR
jgi:hypothetical protein